MTTPTISTETDNHNIIHWNCRGYSSNYLDLKRLIRDTNPTCLCLQETMQGSQKLPVPRGYSIVKSNHSGGTPGTGLAILIKTDTPYSITNLNTNLQAIAINVHLNSNLTICNLYLSPSETIHKSQLRQLIRQLKTPFIIVGDLNGRHPLWGDSTTNPRGTMIEEILTEEDVNLLNDTSPTHFCVASGSSSCLDLSICSPEIYTTLDWKTSDDLYHSDHYPVILQLTRNPGTTTEANFNLNKADWGLFHSLTDIQCDHEDMTADQMASLIETKIITAAYGSIPLNKISNKGRRLPYWSDDCHRAHKQKKQALRRYQRTKATIDKIAFKRARAYLRKTTREAAQAYWCKYITNINETTPMKNIYNKVKKIQGQHIRPHAASFHAPDGALLSTAEVGERIGEYFANVSSNSHYLPEFQPIKSQREARPLNFHSNMQEPYNEPLTMRELDDALRRCKNTAPGSDRIPFEMLKHIHPNMTILLLKLFNKCWLEGVFPNRWTEAIVLPFPKPGKPGDDPAHFRPIALTICICKLMEKMIYVRFAHYLETNNILSSTQFGYRTMRSTEDALVKLETAITNAFINRRHLIAIFFDLEKAYDTTWRYGILETVYESGIRGPLALFIQNFLRNRSFKVKIGAETSTAFPQEQGVPQGSVLSCLLFILAINNATKNLPYGVQSSMYVDDLAIYAETSYIPTGERKLQLAVNQMSSWCASRGFKFSTQKTVGIDFSRRRSPGSPQIYLHNQLIDFKNHTKFLGLTFDKRLNWKEHISQLRSKALKSLNLLRTLSHLKWGADRKSLLRIYRTTIRSKLDYGSQIYATAKEKELNRLNVIHNSALRLSTGAFRSSPIVSLYAETGEPSLHSRRNQLTIQHYLRLQKCPENPATTSANDTSYDEIYSENPGLTAPFGVRARKLLQDMQLELLPDSVLPFQAANKPPWKIPSFSCPCYTEVRKDGKTAALLKRICLDHINEAHGNSTHLYTDGSKTTDSAGFAVLGPTSSRQKRIYKEASIHSCELLAIFSSLRIIQGSDDTDYTIFTDSRSSMQTLEKYNTRNPIAAKIQEKLTDLLSGGKNIRICWTPSHVGIPGNEEVASLALEATKKDRLTQVCLPHTDFYPIVKRSLREKWAHQWTNTTHNKLREIKNDLGPWPSSYQKDRRVEVSLCRLRIGHTLTTHQHLMERRPQETCTRCDVPLTVKHILLTCPVHNAKRIQHFNRVPTSLEPILGRNVNLKSLFKFLNEINFNKI